MKGQDEFGITTKLLILAVCLATILLAQSTALVAPGTHQQAKLKTAKDKGSHPLWLMDLHPLGHPPEDRRPQWVPTLESFDTTNFLSDDVVFATFVTKEVLPGLQRRDDPNLALPFRLHAIFFDATTGKQLKILDWPLPDFTAGIFPRYDGSFLFFSTDRIVLYSADWNPVKELSLRQFEGRNSSVAEVAESPDGKTIVVRIRHQDSDHQCIRIVTATLDGAMEPCSVELGFAISDQAVASTISRNTFTRKGEPGQLDPVIKFRDHGPVTPDGASQKVLIRAGDGPTQTLCNSHQLQSCGIPAYVTNDLIAVYNGCRLSLVDLTGTSKDGRPLVIFQKNFESPMGPDWLTTLGKPVRPSANGQRFAVALNAPLGREDTRTRADLCPIVIPALVPDKVEVYDLRAGGWVYTLENTKRQFKHIWGLALSPTGQKLVIDSGGVLQMYELPSDTMTASH